MGDLSFRWVEINWRLPLDIANLPWEKVNVYRSYSESVDYSNIAMVDATGGYGPGGYITTFKDSTQGATKNAFYLVTYLKLPTIESKWLTTVFSLTPRETRLIEFVKGSTPPIINQHLDDFDYRSGLLLSLQLFNLTPPLTTFSIEDFPYEYEIFLRWGCLYMAALSQLLNISIRDFDYTVPGGLTLRVDRGAKINNYLKIYTEDFENMLKTVKMNFASKGVGLGTIQLPLSLGGLVVSRVMNLFDLFKMSL